ncbi:MAG: hypothetical protein CMH98_03630 [Oceanospirillaceae bacterium]|nr:hypothetical protein [Oceanospirillaceae bacterium]
MQHNPFRTLSDVAQYLDDIGNNELNSSEKPFSNSMLDSAIERIKGAERGIKDSEQAFQELIVTMQTAFLMHKHDETNKAIELITACLLARGFLPEYDMDQTPEQFYEQHCADTVQRKANTALHQFVCQQQTPPNTIHLINIGTDEKPSHYWCTPADQKEGDLPDALATYKRVIDLDNKDEIRTAAIETGFSIKPGQSDLKDYVYEFAVQMIQAGVQKSASQARYIIQDEDAQLYQGNELTPDLLSQFPDDGITMILDAHAMEFMTDDGDMRPLPWEGKDNG